MMMMIIVLVSILVAFLQTALGVKPPLASFPPQSAISQQHYSSNHPKNTSTNTTYHPTVQLSLAPYCITKNILT